MVAIDILSKKFSPEHALVILACRVFVGTSSKDELNAFISEHTFDWDVVYNIICRHQITQVADQVFSSIKIPDQIKEKLKSKSRFHTIENFENSRELVRIYNLLREKNIKVFPYKGLAYAVQFYGNIGLRESRDIDFLIDTDDYNDINSIIEILKSDNYIPMNVIPEGYNDRVMKNTCEFYFDKYDEGRRKFHVEFHWFVHHPVFDLPEIFPSGILLKNPDVNLFKKPIEAINRQNNLLAILLHHGVRENWNSLKYILDVTQAMKAKNINWLEVVNICREYNFYNYLNAGLQLAEELFGANVENLKLTKTGTQYLQQSIFIRKKRNKNIFFKQLRKINRFDATSAKFKMFKKQLRYLFEPSVRDYTFLPLPAAFYFLYFFIKPFRRTFAKKDGVRQ